MPSSGTSRWADRVREGMRELRNEPAAPSRYEPIEELGRGGMGTVYRARDRELGRLVALKILRDDALPAARRRFRREAQTAAKLAHPNVVTVYDVGEEGGRPYLVMELLEASPLEHVLRTRPLPLRAMIQLLEKASRGVAHAHARGVVHRDVKPANILLTASGEPKVADFGLARAAEDTALTASAALGTPLYMAPEQADGRARDIGPRTDVYALGAVLYRMLCGRPPHGGETAAQVLRRITDDEPVPPRRINPDVPRDVETVCLKALDKNPARRYADAGAFADDLRRTLEGEPIRGRSPGLAVRLGRFARRHKASSAVAGVTVAFLIGFGAWEAVRAVTRDRLERAALAAQERGDWGVAAEGFARAERLAPHDASLRTRRRAAEEMERALRARDRRDAARARSLDRALPDVDASAPASAKEARWKAEDIIEQAIRDAAAAEFEAEQAALAALAFDPAIVAARRILADVCVARYSAAVTAHDRQRWARQAEAYGASVMQPATLALATRPAGAAAYVFRYEERMRRLVPLPCDGARRAREVDLCSVDALSWDAAERDKRAAREAGAYPLDTGASHRATWPMSLAPGSYLVLLRRDGCADTRFPVMLRSGERYEREVTLLTPELIPPGFVYVPAGPYIAGSPAGAGDFSHEPRAERTVEVEGFLMARFSVTNAEYLEFLNDLGAAGAKHASRSEAEHGVFFRRSGERFSLGARKADEPVMGISQPDAEAYAQWFTRRHGRGRWTFRLPTEDEWEKAARGADGRLYPWGDRFDASFAATCESRAVPLPNRPSILERIGLFPADESPYGVRDMAGVIGNWTSTRSSDGAMVVLKGASWQSPAVWAQAGTHRHELPPITTTYTGLRLAASLPALEK